jgi:hypothetical protein
MKLKKILFAVFAAVTFGNYVQAQDPNALKYAETITAEDLKKHLSVLASDEFEGRETGKEGQKKAAKYIVNHFSALGLKNISGEGDDAYLQKFNLHQGKLRSLEIKGKKQAATFPDDMLMMSEISPEDFGKEYEYVFGGYGIESEEYNDYAKFDPKGKFVVILSGEPKDKDGKSVLKNAQKEQINNMSKIKKAYSKGAKGVLVVYESDELFGNVSRLYAGYFREAGLKLPSKSGKDNPSTFFASPTAAAKIFNIKPKKFLEFINQPIKESKAGSLKANAVIRGTQDVKEVGTENVLSFLEGTDLKDEVVVLTAHYDHIGIVNGQINNGADDDGSGTSAILELAEAFALAAKDGIKPRRSILFMTFTGEEKGLLGSEYYSENPIIPLEKTIVNLNIDMIGRLDYKHENDPNYVYIIGSDMLSSDLHALSERVQKAYSPDMKLDYRYNDKNDPNQFYYRSDHYNFAKFDIPVIFYFTGVHDDYHRPTDDVEKIHFPKTEKITRLIFATAWELANGDKKPHVDKPTKQP